MVVIKKPTHAVPQDGMHLDRPYRPYKNTNDDWDTTDTIRKSLFAFQSTMKVNGITALVFYVITAVLTGFSLTKSFTSNRFPTSIVTHSVSPWDNLTSLDSTLKTFDGTQGTVMWNVQTLWSWSQCDQYITTGRVPSQTNAYTLAQVSPANPIYMPGGCNCLAQVGNAIGPTWSYAQTTSPTKSEVTDMIRFCVYEADMPSSYTPRHAAYRPLFYFYAFMLLTTLSIILANFMHDGGATTVKNMIVGTNGKTDENVDNEMGKSLSWLQGKLTVSTFFLVGTGTAYTFTFLYSCNSCDQGLTEFNMGFPLTYFLLVLALSGMFIIPYVITGLINGKDNLYEALKKVVSSETDSVTQQYLKRGNYAKLAISDALNAQAQLEQLWTDIMSIPAFVMLSIGITLTRQWTDEGILFYNALLVFVFTVIGTAGNWVTCHWTRAVRAEQVLTDNATFLTYKGTPAITKKGTGVYDFYQGYKDMITYTQIFILVALVFTAVPSGSITPYSYILFYNWFYFIFALFLVYVFPDIINDRVGLTMHMVTAIRQFAMLFLVLTLIITIGATEWLTVNLFTYPNIPKTMA
eukprot:16344-Hanusia_phi.AAC.7